MNIHSRTSLQALLSLLLILLSVNGLASSRASDFKDSPAYDESDDGSAENFDLFFCKFHPQLPVGGGLKDFAGDSLDGALAMGVHVMIQLYKSGDRRSLSRIGIWMDLTTRRGAWVGLSDDAFVSLTTPEKPGSITFEAKTLTGEKHQPDHFVGTFTGDFWRFPARPKIAATLRSRYLNGGKPITNADCEAMFPIGELPVAIY